VSGAAARAWEPRLALAAAILLAAALAWPLRGYVTDDTFIHLQYARHLSEGQGFVFNPGERVYGTTSPLWVLLLANAMALGVDGLAAAKALGGLATLAAIVLWAALLRRTLASPRLAALATLAWAGHAWMLRWSLSGMETPLAVALVLAGLVAFTASEPWGARARAASLLWALAGLARPECGLLLPLWALLEMARSGPVAGARRALAGLWPGLLLLAGWAGFALAWFGRAWPNTLAAKAAGGAGLAYHLEQVARQAAIVASTDGALALVLAVAAAEALRRGALRGARPSPDWLPAAWLAAVPLLYLLRGVPVLSRYLVPLLPVLAWLGWRALDRALTVRPAGATAAAAGTPGRGGLAWLGVAVGALALVQNLVVWQRVVRPQVESFSAGMRTSLMPWGEWLAANTPPDAVIAAPDIGALGYLGRRRVVDLAGLVTPQMVEPLRKMPQEEAIARFEFARFARPDYVVDRAPRTGDLARRSEYGAALVEIGYAELPNLGVARPEPAVYTFYQVDWAAFDSLRRAR
jgi:hypothetical protein